MFITGYCIHEDTDEFHNLFSNYIYAVFISMKVFGLFALDKELDPMTHRLCMLQLFQNW